LQGAQCANDCSEDKIAYEFVSQAFLLYEEDISDSKAQMELVLTSAGNYAQAREDAAEPARAHLRASVGSPRLQAT
jgi:hypothetical protein